MAGFQHLKIVITYITMNYEIKSALSYCRPECSHKLGKFPGEDCTLECKVAWNNLVRKSIIIKEVIEIFARESCTDPGKKWIIKVESIYSPEDIVSL
jgi:hypothetical protein